MNFIKILNGKDVVVILILSSIILFLIFYIQLKFSPTFKNLTIQEGIKVILQTTPKIQIILTLIVSLLSGFNIFTVFKNKKLITAGLSTGSLFTSLFSGVLATLVCPSCLFTILAVLGGTSFALAGTGFLLKYKNLFLLLSLAILTAITYFNLKKLKNLKNNQCQC